MESEAYVLLSFCIKIVAGEDIAPPVIAPVGMTIYAARRAAATIRCLELCILNHSGFGFDAGFAAVMGDGGVAENRGEVMELVAVGEEAVVFLQLLVGVGGGAPLKLADDEGFVTEVQGFVAGINKRLVALGPGEVVVVEL